MAFCFPTAPPLLQEQNKESQKLWRTVKLFMQKELDTSLQDTHFLLAVSGGADSLALLCLWQWLCQTTSCSFSVLHINHGLRPESKDEAHSLAALCSAWNISFFIEHIDVPQLAAAQKLGIEETARKERYALLEHHRAQCHASWICLGHHLQDVQEDMLMRLIRGTGWPALGGMVAKDSRRRMLRPLLLQHPQALRNLLTHAGLSWAEDASNTDTRYLRNRVRHTIVPLLQAENPSLHQKTAELWQFAQYDAAHWQEILDTLCKEYCITYQEIPHENGQKGGVRLPNTLLKRIDKATRLRLYMHAVRLVKDARRQEKNTSYWQNKAPLQSQVRAETLFQLDAALQEGRGNTLFQLPGRITAYLKKGSIVFSIDYSEVKPSIKPLA